MGRRLGRVERVVLSSLLSGMGIGNSFPMPIQFLRTPGIENQGDACYNDWRIASRRFSGKSPLGLDFSTSSVLTTLVVGTGSVTIRAL